MAGLKSEAYGSTPGDDLREDDGDPCFGPDLLKLVPASRDDVGLFDASSDVSASLNIAQPYQYEHIAPRSGNLMYRLISQLLGRHARLKSDMWGPGLGGNGEVLPRRKLQYACKVEIKCMSVGGRVVSALEQLT